MNKDEYIKVRLEDQIKWYDDKSQYNQKWFKRLRKAEIICAAAIPFIAGFSETVPHSNVVIGVIGIIIALCAGISALNKYQENWINYRNTCETLKHEKYLFITSCSSYQGDDSFTKFVERIESLISKENSLWSRNTSKKSDIKIKEN